MPISAIDRAQEEIVELLEAGKSIADVVNHWIQTDPQVIALLLLEQRIQHIVFAEYLLGLRKRVAPFMCIVVSLINRKIFPQFVWPLANAMH